MPLSPELVVWLTKQGHDAIHAYEVGLGQSSDIIILEYARNENRIVVTADLDYPRLLALMQVEEVGLILFRNGNYGEQESIERLKRVLDTIPASELLNSIIVIEEERIRRRRLPI